MSNSMYDDVVAFYDRMGFKRPAIPTALNSSERMRFISYLLSEIVEFGDANEITDQVDAATDMLYFVLDVFVELGVNPAVPFAIVHEANMAKLWSDGLPRFDHSLVPPRMMKPDNWNPPNEQISDWLKAIIESKQNRK